MCQPTHDMRFIRFVFLFLKVMVARAGCVAGPVASPGFWVACVLLTLVLACAGENAIQEINFNI